MWGILGGTSHSQTVSTRGGARMCLLPTRLQVNLAIGEPENPAIRKGFVRPFLHAGKYPGYSEENTGPNILNHSETILAIVKLVVHI